LEVEEAVPGSLLEVAASPGAGLGTPVTEPPPGIAPGSYVDLLSPDSAERVLHIEQRLEFWHQRLASAAKLRGGATLPAREGGAGAGDAAGEQAAEQQELQEGAAAAAWAPSEGRGSSQGGGEGAAAPLQLDGAFSAAAAAPGREEAGSGAERVAPAAQLAAERSLSEPLSEPSFAAGVGVPGGDAAADAGELDHEGNPLSFSAAALAEEEDVGDAKEAGVLSPGGSRLATPPRPIPAAPRSPGEVLESHPIELSPSGSTWLGSSVSSSRPGSLPGAGTPASGSLLLRSVARSLPPWPEAQQEQQAQQVERTPAKVSFAPQPSILGSQPAAPTATQTGPQPLRLPLPPPPGPAAPPTVEARTGGSSGLAFSYRPASRVTQLPPSPTKPQRSSSDGQAQAPPPLQPQASQAARPDPAAQPAAQAPAGRRSFVGNAAEVLAGPSPGRQQLSERLAAALASNGALPAESENPARPSPPSQQQQRAGGHGKAAGVRRAVPVAMLGSKATGASRKGLATVQRPTEGAATLVVACRHGWAGQGWVGWMGCLKLVLAARKGPI
jgi:hypothetical protein